MRPEAMNYQVTIATFTVVRERPRHRERLCQPEAVARLARALIPDDAREHFGAFYLDAQNQLVAYVEISTGSLSATVVHPREVFAPAFRLMGVASLVLVHNHPSGDVTPSREDRRLSDQLREAGRLLDVQVHDHVIITHDGAAFHSMASEPR